MKFKHIPWHFPFRLLFDNSAERHVHAEGTVNAFPHRRTSVLSQFCVYCLQKSLTTATNATASTDLLAKADIDADISCSVEL